MLALGRGRLDLALEMVERKLASECRPTDRTDRAAAAWSRALGLVTEADQYDRLAGQNPAGDPTYHLVHSSPGTARDAAAVSMHVHRVACEAPTESQATLLFLSRRTLPRTGAPRVT